MTACVNTARTTMPRIPVTVLTSAELSGTADQQSRVFARIRGRARHVISGTANAVGVYAPPGFKSPILR
jgi:hypothetical protein